MRPLPERSLWPSGLGMTAVVLGHVALILFFLPVLGIPLAVLGLGIGVIGIVLTFLRWGVGLRWGLAGLAVCALALSVTLALHYAPKGELESNEPPSNWNPPPDRPFVPPPAKPEFLSSLPPDVDSPPGA
jgi:hypothetical protein